MTDSRVQVIQRICERLAVDGGAVRLDMVGGHPRLRMDQRHAQQQARRELTLLGWKVIEGREHTLTVMGWSRDNLAYRLRTLLLACGMLRHERHHTVHVAIACAERHLEAGHPVKLSDVLDAARDEVARELRWPAHLKDVGDLDRRALDPGIAAQLEHIRRLEAEHWVIYQRHAGAQVAPRDQESWAEAIESLALLEGFVTARAAPHMTADDFARMREIDREMYADVEELDILGLTEHNEAFHRVLYERCPNRMLRREVELAAQRLSAMRSTIYFPMAGRGRSAIEEHAELIAMLEARAPADELERFAREHRLKTIAAERRSATSVA